MEHASIELKFSQRVKDYSKEIEALNKKFNTISLLRLGTGLGIGICIYVAMAIGSSNSVLSLMGGFLIAFLFFIYLHGKTKKKLEFCRSLVSINQNEINCFNENYEGNFNGEIYTHIQHSYTSDLDVFGNHSLYQCFCRAGTKGGRSLLASWLKEKSAKKEILERQQAAIALTGELEWRQHLQAYASALETQKSKNKELEEENINDLQDWLEEENFLVNKKWVGIAIRLIQFSSICLVAITIIGIAPFKVLFIPAVFNFILHRKYVKEINSLREKTFQHTRFLKTYSKILSLIETKQFSLEKLNEVKKSLNAESLTASTQIEKLSGLLFNLEATQNPYFYPIGNLLFSWDLHWIRELENWKHRNRHLVQEWFNVIYYFEAVTSIASVAYLNPDWVFPHISEKAFELEAKDLGHPLIKRNKRVVNNISMEGAGKCIVLTGSNMSGKSTFLRTVGVTTTMALAGFPIPATYFKTGLVDIFTSMRTQDSLDEGTSSFYAELKRLKTLLEKISPAVTIFYLLDEILKGTNSEDRHQGAKALIHQLNKTNATGFISTHDLELGTLEKSANGKVINYSFNSYLESGILRFDYKLNRGICNSFNASELMKQIGIKFNDQEIEQ